MKKLFRFAALLLLCAPIAAAGPRNDLGIATKPPKPFTADEAKDFLEKFRHSWFGSDLALSFNLVHRPRHGDDTVYSGLGWTTWASTGPVIRIQITKPAANGQPAQTWHWLLQNGATPHAWVLAPGATAAVEIPPSKWREPFLPGFLYTPFDLLLPFLYWPESTYNKTDRILTRGVDIFTLNPPADEKAAGLNPVKIFIDRELGPYGTLVRSQELDAKGAVAFQFDLIRVAHVHDQWMLQSCQLLDEKTGDYDEFVVKSAAVPTKDAPFALDSAIFTPAGLATPPAELPIAAWSNL